jgi:hypothetical protein
MLRNSLDRVLDRLDDDRLLAAGPVDLVLDDPTLERVPGDPKQVGGFDDAASGSQGLLTEEAFGVGEVEAFEVEAHDGSLDKDFGANKAENVFLNFKKTSM